MWMGQAPVQDVDPGGGGTAGPGTQPFASQASPQLGKLPTHGVEPAGVAHDPSLFLIRHFVLPDPLVEQQETAAGFPHVDFFASFCTSPLHCGGS